MEYFIGTTIRMLQKWKLKPTSFHFDLPMLLKQQGMNAATLLSEWQILISKWKLSCPDMVSMEKLSVLFEGKRPSQAYVNSWFPVSGTVWAGSGGVSLGVGYETSKDCTITVSLSPHSSLCLLLEYQDVRSQPFLLPCLCSIILGSNPLKL